jgi:hypothetical protein
MRAVIRGIRKNRTSCFGACTKSGTRTARGILAGLLCDGEHGRCLRATSRCIVATRDWSPGPRSTARISGRLRPAIQPDRSSADLGSLGLT